MPKKITMQVLILPAITSAEKRTSMRIVDGLKDERTNEQMDGKLNSFISPCYKQDISSVYPCKPQFHYLGGISGTAR